MAPIRNGLTYAMLYIFLFLRPVLAASRLETVVSLVSQSSLTPTSSTTLSMSMSTRAATSCNGQAKYCTRPYSNITFVGAHDSPFVGPLLQHNQNIGIKAQLDMGIRYLQAQTHHSILDNKTIELCHTSCLLEDAGRLKSFLKTIKTWLDQNPDEVVTLLLTNGDSLSVTRFGDTFASSGIANYAYVPPKSPLPIAEWPTLGDMIASGKRLVVFLGKSNSPFWSRSSSGKHLQYIT